MLSATMVSGVAVLLLPAGRIWCGDGLQGMREHGKNTLVGRVGGKNGEKRRSFPSVLYFHTWHGLTCLGALWVC